MRGPTVRSSDKTLNPNLLQSLRIIRSLWKWSGSTEWSIHSKHSPDSPHKRAFNLKLHNYKLIKMCESSLCSVVYSLCCLQFWEGQYSVFCMVPLVCWVRAERQSVCGEESDWLAVTWDSYYRHWLLHWLTCVYIYTREIPTPPQHRKLTNMIFLPSNYHSLWYNPYQPTHTTIQHNGDIWVKMIHIFNP